MTIVLFLVWKMWLIEKYHIKMIVRNLIVFNLKMVFQLMKVHVAKTASFHWCISFMLPMVLHDRDSLTPIKWIIIGIVRSEIDISTHNSLIWFVKLGRLRWSIMPLQHFKGNFVWFVNGKLTRGLSKSHREGLHFREDKWQKIKEGKGPFVVWTFSIQKKIQICLRTSETTAQKTKFSWKCVNFREKSTIKRLY